MSKPLIIATRGSALALAQSNMMKAAFEAIAERPVVLKVIKTTGDKLQAVPATQAVEGSTKGLFTKELEIALLNNEADFAVHSLKDLPTELPEGLVLGAVSKREDVRDVLLLRPDNPAISIATLPPNCIIATSSTRRAVQIQAIRPDVKTIPIRGNVGTRIKKLLTQSDFTGTILAAAGLNRLHIDLAAEGVKAIILPLEEMLPCVGQAAIGIEIRKDDPVMTPLCQKFNDLATFACVTAERAFLRGMGGGCLSPVAAHATLQNSTLHLRAVALQNNALARAELQSAAAEAKLLGARLAKILLAHPLK
jgi:hydroxymethylbilane synthase